MIAINRLRSMFLIAALAITCSVTLLTNQADRAEARIPITAETVELAGAVLKGSYTVTTWLVGQFPVLGTFAGDWAYDTFGGGK